MPAPPLPLRRDFDGRKLRLIAAAERGLQIKMRLLALAEIYDGNSRTYAAEIGGVSLQALRSWVVKFNAGGPDALRNNFRLVGADPGADRPCEPWRSDHRGSR